MQFADPALGIVQVAEDDRLRRAGLRAGGDDLAVANRAPLVLRRILTASIRWTQKVHFSITPRERTVTSGLWTIFSIGEIVLRGS